MIVPGFDVILLVFIGFSVLIWLGVFRKWAVRERQGDVYAPAIPWMTLGFVIMRVVLFLAQLGVPIPSIPIPGLPFPGKVTLVLAPLLLGPRHREYGHRSFAGPVGSCLPGITSTAKSTFKGRRTKASSENGRGVSLGQACSF